VVLWHAISNKLLTLFGDQISYMGTK